ncbi:uncharacterized protein LOC128397065 isoform X1 [Panonychus citri]|uniref:uncharacterized protein LOC128397065 isoform X1 n=2 Tax=Panonychus citri TaxID=50023 RepID=UPI0023076E16|nr:uncharacterized protein LOC128397065 isoform X1 [Panonychus citri]XP_053213706.1 uncharacterized protein LOC128397065 isoform X1 [Panonychus citri]XP_053213707.1 uncharacterized protein LOC128397065 isoform X1 [Panonychus citri]
MNKSWILIFLVFCALLARTQCQSADGMEGMEGLDDDDDEDYDDNERQLGGSVRDAVRNFVSGTVKYITNTRLIPSVVSQAFRRPGAAVVASGATGAATSGLAASGSSVGSAAANAAASAAANSAVDGGMAMSASNAIETAATAAGSALSASSMGSPMASLNSLANFNALLPISTASNQIQQAGEFIGNVFRTMRSNWARRNQEQQQEIRKRLSAITKRLTNSRVVLGTLHRLTGREDTEQGTPVAGLSSTGDMKTSESKIQQTIAQAYPQLIPVPYFAPF